MALPDALDVVQLARAWVATMPDGPVDWGRFRKCGICRAETGHACRTLTSVVTEESRPAGPPIELTAPHGFRKRRTGR